MTLNIRPDIAQLEESQIVEVWRMGFDYPDTIGMWVGQGDLPTPRFICDATTTALADGTYVLQAFAIDSVGHRSASRRIRLIVDNTP